MRSLAHSAAGSALVACLVSSAQAPAAAPDLSSLRIVTDQAEAALSILDHRALGESPSEEDWRRLRESEGYQRLKRRQEAFGATDFDGQARSFLADAPEPVARREALRRTLADWRALDLATAGAQALAYLPAGSTLGATIYPVIKRTTNSFVFELDTDPAIFLYMDPEIPPAKLANTLAHELHHVGGSHNCPQPEGYDELSQGTRNAIDWLSGFGEGLAMLAAAGGPDVDPHAASSEAERAVWERNLLHFDRDVERLEAFFLAIVRDELTDDERVKQGFTFINTDEAPQGAFYTVGWRMAAEIERAKGRGPVIEAICDPRVLLTAYNEVVQEAGDDGRVWSPELIDLIYGR